jgi:hypothetical protein
MKNFILLLLLTTTILAIKAESLNSYYSSKYDKTYTAEEYIPTKLKTISKLEGGYSFPLQSKDKFITTLENYFTAQQKKQNLFYYQYGKKNIEGHVFGGYEYNKNSDSNYGFTYYGFEVKAQYKKLKMNGKWWKGHTSTNDDYSSNSHLINSWVQRKEDVIYIDKIQGEITYDFTDWASLSLKRNKIDYGTNIGGSIILNDQSTNDYSYLKSHITFGDFAVELLHANLICDSLNTTEQVMFTKSNVPDKYMAMHSFTWTPNNSFNAFVGEQIYYGSRNVDINYMLPVGFWRVTEHNQADRDNILIFGGFNYTPQENTLIYTNAIFDELSKSKLFTSWWGNKYSLQAGVIQSNIIETPYFKWNSIGAEFTAVRPWMYTHKFIYAKASNDNQPLGFDDGSNLIKYTIENNLSFWADRIEYTLNASYIRQGAMGNSYSLNYDYEIDDTDDFTTSWLEGGITDKISIKNELDFNFLYSHRVKTSIELIKVDSESIEKEFLISYQTRF